MTGAQDATVTLSQIATLAGVRPSAVSNWRKRFEDFPPPVATAAGGRDLYALNEVEAWLLEHDRFDPGRKSEKLLLEAASVLRGQLLGGDEGIAAIAAAVALAEFCDRLGVPAHESVADRIAEIERDSPGLKGVFGLLGTLDSSGASQLMALADAIDESRRVDVFEWVLSQRRRFVETRTSDEITELLVALVAEAETVLDPAAGEAGVLTAITLASADKIALNLYGQEINEAAWRIAVQRLFLHLVFADVEHADSLLNDQFASVKVDAVACDPPYGMRNPLSKTADGSPPWANFNLASTRTADFAWLEYAIDHLAPDGRAYVVLPAGTLFRKGRERDLRADLLRRAAVEAVIGLPAGAAERTAIPLALWVLQPPQSATNQAVLIINASGEADGANERLTDQVDRMKDTLQTWRTRGTLDANTADFAAAVPVVDLLAADTDLTPAHWVVPVAASPEDQRHVVREEMEKLNTARQALVNSTVDLPGEISAQAVEWVNVRQLVAEGVAEVIRGIRVKPEECLEDGRVRILRTRDIQEGGIVTDDPCYLVPAKTPPPALTEPGDIVVSPASGRLRAVVDDQGEHALAAPLQALRFRQPWLDPYIAAAFLASRRNRRFAKGLTWGYARVDLRDLEVPHLPPHEAERLRALLERLAETEQAATKVREQARDVREAILDSVSNRGGGR